MLRGFAGNEAGTAAIEYAMIALLITTATFVALLTDIGGWLTTVGLTVLAGFG
jgi:Flp pilus assembly pilin Flp